VTHEVAPSDGRVTTVLKNFQIIQRMVGDGDFTVQDPTGTLHRFRLSRSGLLSRQLSNGTSELTQYDNDGRCHRKITMHPKRPNAPWIRRFDYSPAGDLLTSDDSSTAPRRTATMRLID
jgi:hypothetical protein